MFADIFLRLKSKYNAYLLQMWNSRLFLMEDILEGSRNFTDLSFNSLLIDGVDNTWTTPSIGKEHTLKIDSTFCNIFYCWFHLWNRYTVWLWERVKADFDTNALYPLPKNWNGYSWNLSDPTTLLHKNARSTCLYSQINL